MPLDLVTIGLYAVIPLVGIWIVFFSNVDDDDDQGGGGLTSPIYDPVYTGNTA